MHAVTAGTRRSRLQARPSSAGGWRRRPTCTFAQPAARTICAGPRRFTCDGCATPRRARQPASPPVPGRQTRVDSEARGRRPRPQAVTAVGLGEIDTHAAGGGGRGRRAERRRGPSRDLRAERGRRTIPQRCSRAASTHRPCTPGTVTEIAAKLALLAPASTRRAELRAAIATEMGLGGSHPAVIREANRWLRAT